MNEKDLLELGFIDTSFFEENEKFTEFTLTKDNFVIEVSGINHVEIKLSCGFWNHVPNCNSIQDLKILIKLFINN